MISQINRRRPVSRSNRVESSKRSLYIVRALLEKLSAAVKEDLRLGLVGPSLARQLTRLPVGNQEALLALTRRETLTAQEVSGVIDLLQGASQDQVAFVLAKPREALVHGMPTALRDPRLSRAGNWLARHLAQALEAQDLAIARSQR